MSLLACYVASNTAYEAIRAEIKARGPALVKSARGDISLRRYAVMLGASPSWLSKVERGVELLPPKVAQRIMDLAG